MCRLVVQDLLYHCSNCKLIYCQCSPIYRKHYVLSNNRRSFQRPLTKCTNRKTKGLLQILLQFFCVNKKPVSFLFCKHVQFRLEILISSCPKLNNLTTFTECTKNCCSFFFRSTEPSVYKLSLHLDGLCPEWVDLSPSGLDGRSC